VTRGEVNGWASAERRKEQPLVVSYYRQQERVELLSGIIE